MNQPEIGMAKCLVFGLFLCFYRKQNQVSRTAIEFYCRVWFGLEAVVPVTEIFRTQFFSPLYAPAFRLNFSTLRMHFFFVFCFVRHAVWFTFQPHMKCCRHCFFFSLRAWYSHMWSSFCVQIDRMTRRCFILTMIRFTVVCSNINNMRGPTTRNAEQAKELMKKKIGIK